MVKFLYASAHHRKKRLEKAEKTGKIKLSIFVWSSSYMHRRTIEKKGLKRPKKRAKLSFLFMGILLKIIKIAGSFITAKTEAGEKIKIASTKLQKRGFSLVGEDKIRVPKEYVKQYNKPVKYFKIFRFCEDGTLEAEYKTKWSSFSEFSSQKILFTNEEVIKNGLLVFPKKFMDQKIEALEEINIEKRVVVEKTAMINSQAKRLKENKSKKAIELKETVTILKNKKDMRLQIAPSKKLKLLKRLLKVLNEPKIKKYIEAEIKSLEPSR